jgi:epoxyqueuosine reductase QueG
MRALTCSGDLRTNGQQTSRWMTGQSWLLITRPSTWTPGRYTLLTNLPIQFLSWARRGGAGHVSPLGLNIHPTFGLWHAYRAALLFPVAFDLPRQSAGSHPCESCKTKPCLTACPVSAFDGKSYDVVGCAQHIANKSGQDCLTAGCRARLACPVGQGFTYSPQQMQFHMKAFLSARQAAI